MAITAYTLHDVIQPGEILAPGQQDFYTITVEQLEAFLKELKQEGYTSCDSRTFSQWQRGETFLPKKVVLLTFDDGCASHAKTVAPLLKQYGFTGVFFVTSGFVGKPGYVEWSDLKTMVALGMEIGSHGKTHTPLTQLSAADLMEELVGSRNALQDQLDIAVTAIAAPGGFWSPAISPYFKEAGYEAVWLSAIGANHAKTPVDQLKRVSVHQPFNLQHLMAAAKGGGWALWKDQMRQQIIQAFKRCIGVQRYEALKAKVFKGQS